MVGDHSIIPLTKGFQAIVDTASLHLICGWNWSTYGARNMYAGRGEWISGKCSQVLMHRVIMGAPHGVQVDHINGDTLDNRIANMRLVSGPENSLNRKKYKNNTSGVKGVYWNSRLSKWHSQIRFRNKRVHLGFHESIEDAEQAYRIASMSMFGDLARKIEDE